MPAVQHQVSRRRGALQSQPRGKSARGRGTSARGRGGTRGMLKEIKESIVANKEEPLSSDPLVIEDDETEDDKNEEEKETQQKENAPEVTRKHQTVKRGKPFARSSSGGTRKINMTSCSINLGNDCVPKKNSPGTKKPKVKGKTQKGKEEKKEPKVEEKKDSNDEKIDGKSEANIDDKNKEEKATNASDASKIENKTEKSEDIKEEENKIEPEIPQNDVERKTEDMSGQGQGGYEAETMIAYINNSEIDGAEHGNDGAETPAVEDNLEQTQQTEETVPFFESQEDKEHRIAVIGQSLTITKLEDELESELKTQIDVKDTEERIRRLRRVIGLLKGQNVCNMSAMGDAGVEDNTGSGGEQKYEDGNAKQEEYVNSNVSQDDDEKSAKKEEGKTDTSDETSEQVYVLHDGESGTQVQKDAPDVSKTEKHVHFELLSEDDKQELADTFQIKVNVGDCINRLVLMEDDDDEGRHRIDDSYINFPSSQSRAPEIIKQLDEEPKHTLTYTPDVEDITDDDEESGNNKEEVKLEEQDTSSVTNESEIPVKDEVRKIESEKEEEPKTDKENVENSNDEVGSEGKDDVEERKNGNQSEVTGEVGEGDNNINLKEEQNIRKNEEQNTMAKNEIQEDEEKEKTEEKKTMETKTEEQEKEESENTEDNQKVDSKSDDTKSKEDEDTEIRKIEIEKEKVEQNEKESKEDESKITDEDNIENSTKAEKEKDGELIERKVDEGEELKKEDDVEAENEETKEEEKEEENKEIKTGVDDGQISNEGEKENTKDEENMQAQDNSVHSESADDDSVVIRKKDENSPESELVYLESGSDFEENLVEKWKHLKKGTQLKR